MRGRLLNMGAVGRAAGFALVAAAVAVALVRVAHEAAALHPSASLFSPRVPADALARELAHCRALGMAAETDAACKAARAETRRRFFTYRVAPAAPSQHAASAPEGK
jgi:conjugative transfer region protein TrbK